MDVVRPWLCHQTSSSSRSKPVQLGGELRRKLWPDECLTWHEPNAACSQWNGESDKALQTRPLSSVVLPLSPISNFPLHFHFPLPDQGRQTTDYLVSYGGRRCGEQMCLDNCVQYLRYLCLVCGEGQALPRPDSGLGCVRNVANQKWADTWARMQASIRTGALRVLPGFYLSLCTLFHLASCVFPIVTVFHLGEFWLIRRGSRPVLECGSAAPTVPAKRSTCRVRVSRSSCLHPSSDCLCTPTPHKPSMLLDAFCLTAINVSFHLFSTHTYLSISFL